MSFPLLVIDVCKSASRQDALVVKSVSSAGRFAQGPTGDRAAASSERCSWLPKRPGVGDRTTVDMVVTHESRPENLDTLVDDVNRVRNSARDRKQASNHAVDESSTPPRSTRQRSSGWLCDRSGLRQRLRHEPVRGRAPSNAAAATTSPVAGSASSSVLSGRRSSPTPCLHNEPAQARHRLTCARALIAPFWRGCRPPKSPYQPKAHYSRPTIVHSDACNPQHGA